MDISNENKTFHTSMKTMHIYYQRRKSTLKKNCVQQVCMYVCSMTYSCMYVTAWCTKSCDLLSWEIKENNILKCLVSCKVLETVELCESISECSVSIWKTDWYLFISSVTMAPIEDRHLLLPKRLRKHSRRFLAKASGGMGSAKTMPPPPCLSPRRDAHGRDASLLLLSPGILWTNS